MDVQALEVDTSGKELLGENENDFLDETEGPCNFVGVTETFEYPLEIGVSTFCLGSGNFAFTGDK